MRLRAGCFGHDVFSARLCVSSTNSNQRQDGTFRFQSGFANYCPTNALTVRTKTINARIYSHNRALRFSDGGTYHPCIVFYDVIEKMFVQQMLLSVTRLCFTSATTTECSPH
ncbi:hypothetical protein PoB_006807400 [Plakobranchus ocellatus]|uniref:Uncharacterized protein n=1 Tax=Plakobranchus ocellatus TaxID=259542 RepID=A0AAV4DBJ7_9GAST|nr:hypothetical protein PoB_006807400 [Plakobranchus ocellatus]